MLGQVGQGDRPPAEGWDADPGGEQLGDRLVEPDLPAAQGDCATLGKLVWMVHAIH